MFRKTSLILYALVLAGMVFWLVMVPRATGYRGEPIKIELTRGEFTVYRFSSARGTAEAVIIFGSGDGGWGSFEEEIAHALQDRGYDVIGIDFTVYADSDYDLETLQADFVRISQAGMAARPQAHLPLILGGYSMGAAQAVAAAGGARPPTGMVGLLLIDPLSRGRYGLTASDRLDVLPTGPGTFGVAQFASALSALRVVQWHAENDEIDSRAWLEQLSAQHEEFTFPGTGHKYNANRADFLRRLTDSVAWILRNTPPDRMVAGPPMEGP
jgi:pimeloyl-ACP methyl ester carboxylesterase